MTVDELKQHIEALDKQRKAALTEYNKLGCDIQSAYADYAEAVAKEAGVLVGQQRQRTDRQEQFNTVGSIKSDAFLQVWVTFKNPHYSLRLDRCLELTKAQDSVTPTFMKSTISVEWSSFDTGESIGKFATRLTATDGYICPKCGDPCTFREGQIDELPNGAEVRGWWFDCYNCGISSEAVEGNWNGDDY